ncbi:MULTISPECIES: glucose-6-phosphate dehydrogenase [unclassified Rhizobium]|uniref:glucose-6-phosphate dehydrogenase n=1 Tax=unclassified Rhizobium TaxID=2613769 RepID=UPI001FFDF8C2|nr:MULTISPECIES: glucose-6-phosphate dehydrogenase [unclassified Rhizobium]
MSATAPEILAAKADDTRTTPAPADPCAMVLFGAGGDLTRRLVIPALYNLLLSKTLPDKFALIGVDLADGNVESWAKRLREMLETFIGNRSSDFDITAIDEAAWTTLVSKMVYIQGDLTKPDLYAEIGKALEAAKSGHDTQGNAIFYLAVAGQFFGTVIDQLGAAGLVTQSDGSDGGAKFWRRVVIEKPFGHDLASSQALNAQILKVLKEDQIYRIDHFLGKETVQNIMAFRFANGFFERIWNRDAIEQVQITVTETVGVETRGKFYENTGALRDMVPNHLFTLLSMVAMEPPTSFDAASIRSKKAEVVEAIRPCQPSEAVRGQYDAGSVLGKTAVPYRSEANVDPASRIETYVAMQLSIDNPRWEGVPFYVRTGKHLTERRTEIAISFKAAPGQPFHKEGEAPQPNWLVLRTAPDEGIFLSLQVKQPGPEMALANVGMLFRYDDWFADFPNVGYETLIYDVMVGDATLFMRADMVEQAWRVVQPLQDAWAKEEPSFPNYASGSAGPQASDDLLARAGHAWRTLKPYAPKT